MIVVDHIHRPVRVHELSDLGLGLASVTRALNDANEEGLNSCALEVTPEFSLECILQAVQLWHEIADEADLRIFCFEHSRLVQGALVEFEGGVLLRIRFRLVILV